MAAAAMGLMVNHVRPERLPLVADWSMHAQLADVKTGESIEISLEEAKALFETGGAVFLDARPAEFFQLGHIEGAMSLPWESFDSRFDEVMANISPQVTIITYCDGEACALSKDLAQALLEKGFFHVRVLLNGWGQWQQAGLPIMMNE